jgi:putative two-component system response regulator
VKSADISLVPTSGSPDELAAYVHELSEEISRQLAAPGVDSTAFFEAAYAALRTIGLLEGNARVVEALLHTAQYFYVCGLPLQGVQPAADAVQRAAQLDSPALHRKALTFYGILLADTGNLPTAVECYAQALDLARQLGDAGAECSVWNNLGVALLTAAQYQDAIGAFERAISLTGNDESLKWSKGQALSNIALACLNLDDFKKGLRTVKQSIAECDEPTTSTEMLSRVFKENLYTQLLLEVDNVERAKERCDIAKRLAVQSKSARAELTAATAEGLYEVYAGMADVGLSRLTKALERSRVMRSHLRDALVAVVKAYEVAGDPEKALIYLRELMLHTKKVQQDNALHHHRLHLDQLERDLPDAGKTQDVLLRREVVLKGKLAEQELFKSRIELLERLAVTAELRDDSTGEHSYRVGKLASLLAAEYGCDDDTCFMIDIAARLHDIGKIGIPDGILLKPDRLNDAERQLMQTHTVVGAELLAQSNIPHMQMAEEIARYHHEWWDGSGYPVGISGTAIPMAARITALADVYDALTHKRPYKEPWPVRKALDEIASLKGTQFDPGLTDLFLALIPRLQREEGDLDEYLGMAARSSKFIQARAKISETLKRTSDDRFNVQR